LKKGRIFFIFTSSDFFSVSRCFLVGAPLSLVAVSRCVSRVSLVSLVVTQSTVAPWEIRNSVGSPKTLGDEIFDFSILFMGMTHRTTGPRPIVFLPLPDVFEYNYTTFQFLEIS